MDDYGINYVEKRLSLEKMENSLLKMWAEKKRLFTRINQQIVTYILGKVVLQRYKHNCNKHTLHPAPPPPTPKYIYPLVRLLYVGILGSCGCILVFDLPQTVTGPGKERYTERDQPRY